MLPVTAAREAVARQFSVLARPRLHYAAVRSNQPVTSQRKDESGESEREWSYPNNIIESTRSSARNSNAISAPASLRFRAGSRDEPRLSRCDQEVEPRLSRCDQYRGAFV